MPDMPVQMNINARRVAHHALDGDKVLIHPVQIFFLVPDVAVHLLLEGAQGVVRQLRLRRAQLLRKARIAAQIDLLCIVRTARKRRVDVDEIDRAPLLAQIGTRGDALAAYDEILRRILPDALLLRKVIDGHPAPQIVREHVLPMIAQGAPKVVEHRLSLNRVGEKRNISYCHVSSYEKNEMILLRVSCTQAASSIVSSR